MTRRSFASLLMIFVFVLPGHAGAGTPVVASIKMPYSNPTRLVMDSNTGRLYRAAGGFVTVIDTATNSVIKSVGCCASTLAVDTVTNRLYIPLYEYLYGVNADTGSFETAVAIGGRPIDVVISVPRRRAYVLSSTTSKLSVVDLDTRTVVASGYAPYGATRVLLDDEHSTLYMFGNSSISRFDINTNSTVGSIAFGPATDVSLDSLHDRLYVSTGDFTIGVFDTATGAFVQSFQVNECCPGGIAVDQARNHLYVAVKNAIRVLDVATGTEISSWLLCNPVDIEVDPANGRVFVAQFPDHAVAVMSPDQVFPDDVTPPTTIASDFTYWDVEEGNAKWTGSSWQIQFVCEDDLLGCKETFVRVDDTITSGLRKQISISDEGKHTVEYWSVDCSGNEGLRESAVYAVDRTAPKTAVNLPAPVFVTSVAPIVVQATADDLFSDGSLGVGVKDVCIEIYSVNSVTGARTFVDCAAAVRKESGMWEMRQSWLPRGHYDVRSRAKDRLGNEGVASIYRAFVVVNA